MVSDIERAGRFVEHQDRCLRGQRPGDHQSLLLAATQLTQPTVGELCQIKPSQHASNQGSVMSRFGTEVANERCPAKQHIFVARHIGRHQWVLRHVGNECGPTGTRPNRQGGTVNDDLAGVFNDADRRFQQ